MREILPDGLKIFPPLLVTILFSAFEEEALENLETLLIPVDFSLEEDMPALPET